MVDIPLILEAKAKERKEKLLEKALIQLATNNRVLEEEAQKKFIAGLTNNGKDANEYFDREKMEELRMMTNMGANKTR